MFTNSPGDLGSIPGRVIPKTQKKKKKKKKKKKERKVLDATQHYKVRIKGKMEQSRERSSNLPPPWCSSYRKGSLWVTLDYGHQLDLLTNSKKMAHCRKSFVRAVMLKMFLEN